MLEGDQMKKKNKNKNKNKKKKNKKKKKKKKTHYHRPIMSKQQVRRKKKIMFRSH